jgi:16S rRNA processing protein RimM
VHSFTRPEENLLDYPRWWLAGPGEAYEARLIEGRRHGGGLVAQLSDAAGTPIGDRDAAAALVGSEIQVDRSVLPEPEAGQYYWDDLIGLEVQSPSGKPLGRVTGMMDNGAQDVLVLEDGGQERLIPFVPGEIIRSVDLQQRQIVADWEPDW